MPHSAGLARRRTTRSSRRCSPRRRAGLLQPGGAVQQHLLEQQRLHAEPVRARARRSSTRGSSTSRSTGRRTTPTPSRRATRPDQRPDPRAGRGAATRFPAARATASASDPLFVTPFVLELTVSGLAARPADGGGHDHRPGPAGRAHRGLPPADRRRPRSTAACAARTRRSRRRPNALAMQAAARPRDPARRPGCRRPRNATGRRRLRQPVPAAAADAPDPARRGISAPTSCRAAARYRWHSHCSQPTASR